HVDNVMGVSQSVVDFHHDHGLFLGARTRVVHNALKPDLVPAASGRNFPVSRPFVLGFIGRVEKFKGVETLLEAFRTLAGHFPVQLRIAGRGDEAYVASLKEKYGDLPVTFVGFAKNTEFYQAIDALVYPSEWLEALGNSVFEAFSQGVPVVGSDVGGIPETIDHGTNGFIFKAGQPAALAEAMQGVVQDPNGYEQLSVAALKKSHEYAAPRRAQEYIDFLKDVVKGPP
ncbi:MAG: glycosyltransferase, partial [Pseudomonadota bacterium]